MKPNKEKDDQKTQEKQGESGKQSGTRGDFRDLGKKGSESRQQPSGGFGGRDESRNTEIGKKGQGEDETKNPKTGR